MDDLDDDFARGWLSQVKMTTLGRVEGVSGEDLVANKRVVAADSDGVLGPTLAGGPSCARKASAETLGDADVSLDRLRHQP